MEYTVCKRCIMDTSAADIVFDSNGFCNFCTDSINFMNQAKTDAKTRDTNLHHLIELLKQEGKGKDYDCIVGVSGGLDSSYVLYKAKEFGLRPLAVHLDNNWNSELAVNNIERLVKHLNVDLITHVIDWQEFKELQIAFFKSNVIDIEMLTDHALIALLYQCAVKFDCKYLLAGTNTASEGMTFPKEWNHFKIDLPNILDIYRRFGNGTKLRTFPMMSLKRYLMYKYIDKIKWTSILNYLDYKKENAIKEMVAIGWKPYEKKHYESVFTRFYQGYILPQKYNVDKRRIHFSTLICSGQMTREQALKEIQEECYESTELLNQDKEYVLKKLDYSPDEFDAYIKAPGVLHSCYATNEPYYNLLKRVQSFLA